MPLACNYPSYDQQFPSQIRLASLTFWGASSRQRTRRGVVKCVEPTNWLARGFYCLSQASFSTNAGLVAVLQNLLDTIGEEATQAKVQGFFRWAIP